MLLLWCTNYRRTWTNDLLCRNKPNEQNGKLSRRYLPQWPFWQSPDWPSGRSHDRRWHRRNWRRRASTWHVRACWADDTVQMPAKVSPVGVLKATPWNTGRLLRWRNKPKKQARRKTLAAACKIRANLFNLIWHSFIFRHYLLICQYWWVVCILTLMSTGRANLDVVDVLGWSSLIAQWSWLEQCVVTFHNRFFVDAGRE